MSRGELEGARGRDSGGKTVRVNSGEKGEAERREKGAWGSRVSWRIAVTSGIAAYTRHESNHNLITWLQTLTTTLTSSPLHTRCIVFPPSLHRVSPPCNTQGLKFRRLKTGQAVHIRATRDWQTLHGISLDSYPLPQGLQRGSHIAIGGRLRGCDPDLAAATLGAGDGGKMSYVFIKVNHYNNMGVGMNGILRRVVLYAEARIVLE